MMLRVLASLLILACSSAAQNWPSFRGPAASGVGDGKPPTQWDVASGKNVRWKTPIPGLAHSSPIVWNDRVYLTTAVPSKDGDLTLKTGWIGGSGKSAEENFEWSWRLLCISKSDGKVVWDREACKGVPRLKRHEKSTHADSTPATDGKRIVAIFGSQGLYCFDLEGKVLWSSDFGTLEVGPDGYPVEWGYASSPIIHENLVIVQCDARNKSFWAALDLQTGKEIRRVERNDWSSWTTPNIFHAKGRTQLVCNGYKNIAGYDLKSGERIWTIGEAGGDVPVPTPLIAHDRIYITNGHGRSPIFVLDADASGDMTPQEDVSRRGLSWWQPKGGSYMPTPIIVGDRLYVGDDNGRIRAFDAKTGEQIYADRVSSASATFSASPVAADGRIYFTDEDGGIHVIKAGDKFERLASNAMNEICMATPAISQGVLYVRTRAHLYAIAE